MVQNGIQNSKILEKKFYCEFCDFNSKNKKDFTRHLSTDKHKKLVDGISNGFVFEKRGKKTQQDESSENEKISNQKTPYDFTCECGKMYKYQSGLYRHKRFCKFTENNEYKNMFATVINENKELHKILAVQQQQITELIPKVGNTTNLKQKLNINIFLNEKCKDAISMDQFIDQIHVSMKNLLTTKEKGLTEGLSNIIIDNMNKLSLYERPMHCTDAKRETLYIKNNEWEKDEKKEQINELLKKVEKKQMKNIVKWTEANPHYMDNEELQEKYLELVKSCTGSIDGCKDKVIKKVCDNVYIN